VSVQIAGQDQHVVLGGAAPAGTEFRPGHVLDLASVALEEFRDLVGADRQPPIELRASAFNQRKAGHEATEREASEVEDEGKSAHILERQVELGRAY
jgi:hypothetical protein